MRGLIAVFLVGCFGGGSASPGVGTALGGDLGDDVWIGAAVAGSPAPPYEQPVPVPPSDAAEPSDGPSRGVGGEDGGLAGAADAGGLRAPEDGGAVPVDDSGAEEPGCPGELVCTTVGGSYGDACAVAGQGFPPSCGAPGECDAYPGTRCIDFGLGLGAACFLACDL